MKNIRRFYLVVAIMVLVVGSSGCMAMEMGVEEMEMGESIGFDGRALFNQNHVEPNGLPDNGLPDNGLPDNGLPSSTVDTAWGTWLNDPTRGEANEVLMKYLVKCALDSGEAASYDDGSTTFTWPGRVGLASTWKDEAMSPTQRKWVSACLASLVNEAGVSITISQRGLTGTDIDNMESGEATTYTQMEGAYFGDVFDDDVKLYSCMGDGYIYNATANEGRKCALDDDDYCLPIDNVGLCSDVCANSETRPAYNNDKIYYNCDPDGAGTGPTYAEVVTIYLDPS